MDSKPTHSKNGISDRFLCSHDYIQKNGYSSSSKRKGMSLIRIESMGLLIKDEIENESMAIASRQERLSRGLAFTLGEEKMIIPLGIIAVPALMH